MKLSLLFSRHPFLIHTILVPQGAEYQAVFRGIGRTATPIVLPIPVGTAALSRYLQTWQKDGHVAAGQRLLVMGLCGGLTPQHSIADAVLYRDCIDRATGSVLPCDVALTHWLQQTLAANLPSVSALTSDRLVWSASEKQQLAQQYRADVVDMEGFAALESLRQADVSIAMLRVISDHAQHDLPDLTNAISAEGALQPLPLALGMIKQPIAASRLIRGSLRGLKTLQAVAAQLVEASGRVDEWASG